MANFSETLPNAVPWSNGWEYDAQGTWWNLTLAKNGSFGAKKAICLSEQIPTTFSHNNHKKILHSYPFSYLLNETTRNECNIPCSGEWCCLYSTPHIMFALLGRSNSIKSAWKASLEHLRACVRSRQDTHFEALHSWLVFETQNCCNLDQNGKKRHNPIIETGKWQVKR